MSNWQAEEFSYALEEDSIAFSLDEAIYNRDALYGAAYVFVDRCFLYLSRPAEGQIRVRLKGRESLSGEGLENLAGEFANELLNQLVRHQVSTSTKRIREYYMGRAFYGDDTRASIDALLAELDAEELADEPLEIAVPWENETAPDGTSG